MIVRNGIRMWFVFLGGGVENRLRRAYIKNGLCAKKYFFAW